MFGAPNNNNPAGTNPNPTGSIFGQPTNPTGNAFGGFGAPTTAPNTATPGFGGFNTGQQMMPQATTSAFGGFNNQAPANAGTSSVFGRPPAATTGFGFGQQPTAPTNAGFSFGGQGTGIGSSPASTIGNPAAGGGIFGSSPATSSSAFGAAPNTTNTTSIGFGMAPSQQLQTSATVNNGTGNPAYSTTNEKDAIQQNQTFFAISAMPAYRNWSFEQQPSGTTSAFGSQMPTVNTFGTAQPATSAFGAPVATPSTGLFGSAPQTTSAFSGGLTQPTSSAFGAAPTTAFGTQQSSTPSVFGSQPAATTSAFGGQQAATTGGFGGFGQTPQATSSFGGFGAPAATSSFGATPAKTGLFSNTTTPAFGGAAQPAQTAPSAGFSFGGAPAATANKPFGFNQQPNTTATPAATGGFSFGGSSTTATSGFGVAPTATTTSFGQQPTAQPTTSFGAFGSAFNKPAATSMPTSSGTSSWAPSLNLNASAPGSTPSFTGGFQTAPATAPTTTAPTTSSFQFGAAGSTSLFPSSAAPAGTSTAATMSIPSLGAGSSWLGKSTTAAPAPSFSFNMQPTITAAPNQAQVQPTSAWSFGGASTASAVQPQQTVTGPSLTASIDNQAYGSTPFLQPRASATGAASVSQDAFKSSTRSMRSASAEAKPTPVRFFAASNQRDVRLRGRSATPKTSTAAPTAGMPKARDGTSLADPFQTRRSVKKLNIHEESTNAQLTLNLKSVLTSKSKTNFALPRETETPTLVETPVPRSQQTQLTPGTPTNVPSNGFVKSSPLQSSFTPVRVEERKQNHSPLSATKVEESKLNNLNQDYYMRPTLQQLSRLPDSQLGNVSLVVGRKGYGEIRWLDAVDLRVFLGKNGSFDERIRSLEQIPGRVVRFAPKMCYVYEEEIDINGENEVHEPVVKHPPGIGLNCPAEITLNNCWPVDRASRKAITSDESPSMKRFMTKLKSVPDTEFISYDAASGTWVFRVDHFSRYGLCDDDDDDEDIDKSLPKQDEKKKQGLERTFSTEPLSMEIEPAVIPAPGSSPSGLSVPPSLVHIDADRVQQMRKSFFPPTLPQQTAQPKKLMLAHLSSPQKQNEISGLAAESDNEQRSASLAGYQRIFQMEPVSVSMNLPEIPTAVEQQPERDLVTPIPMARPLPSVPLAESLASRANNHSSMLLRTYRSFRASWGWMHTSKGLRMVLIKPSSPSPSGCFKVTVQNISLGCEETADVDRLALEVQRKHSDIVLSVEGVPSVQPRPIEFSQFVRDAPASLTSSSLTALVAYEDQVWKLASALFDPLPNVVAAPSDYVVEQMRKDRFSEWLKEAVQQETFDEVQRLSDDSIAPPDVGSVLFSFLTGRQIKDAVSLALRSRHFHLAMIMSQVSDVSGANLPYATGGGIDDRSKEDLYHQLQAWSEQILKKSQGKESLIAVSQLQIYRLLCSDLERLHEVLASSKLHRLSWRRTLGLYFWYWASGNSPLSESISAYEYSLRTLTCPIAKPVPWYVSQSEQTTGGLLDLQFRLLTFFTGNSTSLDETLVPSSFYPQPPSKAMSLQLPSLPSARLIWLLWRTFSVSSNVNLGNSGMQQDSPSFHSGLFWSAEYVVQLEATGQWHYAVFVALHMPVDARIQVIKDILARNVLSCAEEDFVDNWPFPEETYSSMTSILSPILRDQAARKKHAFTQHSPFKNSKKIISEERIVTRERIQFLTEHLRVPQTWIYEAKALHARYSGNKVAELAYLYLAQDYESAHHLLFQIILPASFVLHRIDLVRHLLAPFKEDPVAQSIREWKREAGLFVDVLELRDKLNNDAPLSADVLAKFVSCLDRLSSLESRRTSGDRRVQMYFRYIPFQVTMKLLADELLLAREKDGFKHELSGVQSWSPSARLHELHQLTSHCLDQMISA